VTLQYLRAYFTALALYLIAGTIFFLLSYNSGYGYDALEYLVIGRSLLDGYRLYDFIPSKSWGLYSFIAVFQAAGISGGHFASTVLTTLIFLFVTAMTFWVVRRTHDSVTASAASFLVALCTVFMELNYLEPEGLVAACGLAAFLCIFRARQNGRNGYYLLGGLFVGLGFAFKSVAGFYFLAILIFVLIQELRDPAKSVSRLFLRELLVIAGLGTALILPMLYFGFTGRLNQHIEWTYLFPLLHRPVETLWLSKLFTKLLWFNVLVVVALAISLRRGVRERIYSRPVNLLALLMGLCSLVALFKQQASHYVFPGAVFLSIFIADVFHEAAPLRRLHEHRLATFTALAALIILLVGSVWLYSPQSCLRLVTFRDYADEDKLARLVQNRVAEGRPFLCFKKSTLLYWVCHRYPPIPFLKLDVQETYVLRKDPGILENVLKNPHLEWVEFDPVWPGIQDRSFMNDAQNRRLIVDFGSRLNHDFFLADTNTSPYVLWQRKHAGP
jgi:hypothetical protein